MKRLIHPAAYAVPISFAAGLWLIVIYRAAGESTAAPGLLVHWLRAAAFALPLVLAGAWAGLRLSGAMLERHRERLTPALEGAVTTAAVALTGGAALAVAMPIGERLFGAGSSSLPLPLHVLRDTLLALLVTVPVAAIVVALRRAAGEVVKRESEPGARRSSRAAFLKAGAGGLVSVAGGTAALRAVSSSTAHAASDTVKVPLLINEGYVKMNDGTPVWMRGFALSATAGSPMVPGPAIGPPAAGVLVGDVPYVLEGQTVEVTIKNTLADPHTFSIPGIVDPPVLIGPGLEATFTFNTPDNPVAAGTYIYQDDDPVQRILGLHGVLVVMPSDGTRRPYADVDRPDLGPAPTFGQQFIWVLHDVDPVWGAQAKAGQPIDFATLMPRYFTINGLSGEQSVESSRGVPNRRNVPLGTVADNGRPNHGSLIRIVNTGAALHSPHFHGNHVYVVTEGTGVPLIGGVPAVAADGRVLVVEKDVLGVGGLDTAEVLLPFHEPLDQWPPYDPAQSYDYRYPMHCHAEMSQTAGGGQYPSGMYVEWELTGPLGVPKAIGG